MVGQYDLDGGETSLGQCPECAGRIPARSRLIRYESASGWPMQFAECPDCGAVVHPR